MQNEKNTKLAQKYKMRTRGECVGGKLRRKKGATLINNEKVKGRKGICVLQTNANTVRLKGRSDYKINLLSAYRGEIGSYKQGIIK